MLNTALGVLGGLAMGQLNNSLSQDNANLAYNRQRSLMALQQQYAVENWQREVNYNSPVEQMKRLKAAGLNPNLVYGNGPIGLESPGISSPGSPSAPMASTVPYHNPFAEGAQAAQAIAMAKKAGSETIAQDLENKYLNATMAERIDAVALQNKWTKEQTALFKQEFAKLTGELNLMQKTAQEKDLNLKWLDRHLAAEVEDLKQSAKYKEAMAKMTDKDRELLDANFDNLKKYTGYTADMLEKTVDLLKTYGDAQVIVGLLSQLVGGAADLIGIFKPKVVIKK